MVQRRKAFAKVTSRDSRGDKKLNHSPHSVPYPETLLFSLIKLLNSKIKYLNEDKE